MSKKIWLSPPHMGDEEKKLLIDAFDSNWIAPLGPYVDLFEENISRYLDLNEACAVSSGTAALHLALITLDIGKGDVVLCPSLTFAASSNVILYQGATPVFIDVNPDTWTLDIRCLEKAIEKYNPKALIAVDLYGQSCDYKSIVELCNKNNVYLIEDAAEAFGSEYNNKKCGSFGKIGILSFNGNKIITTSGGGMLASDDVDLVKKSRFLSTQAKEPFLHYEHIEIGYNYRLSNLLAAIGCAQLKSLDDKVKKRRMIFENYFNQLDKHEGINFMKEADNCYSNRWLTTLTVNSHIAGVNRNQIISMLDKEQIEARPVWKPMHLQKLYDKNDYITINSKDYSRKLFEDGLCLPSGSNLTTTQQNKIIDIILSSLKT